MPVTLVVNPPVVQRGATLTYTVTITAGAPNISDVLIALKSRPEGTVDWVTAATAFVNTDEYGYAQAIFAFTVPMDYPTGNYEVKATASKGAAFEDSNIVVTTVTEPEPPPPPATPWLIVAGTMATGLILTGITLM